MAKTIYVITVYKLNVCKATFAIQLKFNRVLQMFLFLWVTTNLEIKIKLN